MSTIFAQEIEVDDGWLLLDVVDTKAIGASSSLYEVPSESRRGGQLVSTAPRTSTANSLGNQLRHRGSARGPGGFRGGVMSAMGTLKAEGEWLMMDLAEQVRSLHSDSSISSRASPSLGCGATKRSTCSSQGVRTAVSSMDQQQKCEKRSHCLMAAPALGDGSSKQIMHKKDMHPVLSDEWLTDKDSCPLVVVPAPESAIQAVVERLEFNALTPVSKAIEEEFVHVPVTPEMMLRSLVSRQPRLAKALLWSWFALLIFGELLTTGWWLHSIGFHGLLMLGVVAALGCVAAIATLGLEKAGVVFVSLLLAVAPAVPAYSAVLFILPLGGLPGTSERCWEALHWPTFFLIGLMYLGDALRPVLQAGRPSTRALMNVAMVSLNSAQRAARGACIIAVWVYAAVTIHVLTAHLFARGDTDAINAPPLIRSLQNGVLAGPLANSRGLVIAFHAIGLLCAATRQRTLDALGNQLLPTLLGARRANALTLRALSNDYGGTLWRSLPTLRRFAPPRGVVAFIVAMRRVAPLLLTMIALLLQLARVGGIWWSLMLVLGAIALIVTATVSEWHSLPTMPLQRLPLLLPKNIMPLKRTFVGYVLVAVEGAERFRSRLTLRFTSS